MPRDRILSWRHRNRSTPNARRKSVVSSVKSTPSSLRVVGTGSYGSALSPKCPHFLKTRGTVRALLGLKWPEKTKDRGQVVDKINESLGSLGGVPST